MIVKQSLETQEWSLHTIMCTHNICCISSPNTAFVFSIIIRYGAFCNKPPPLIEALFIFSNLCSLCASICIVSIGLFSSSIVFFPCRVQCTISLSISLRFSICLLIMLIVSFKFLNVFIIIVLKPLSLIPIFMSCLSQNFCLFIFKCFIVCSNMAKCLRVCYSIIF